MKARGFEALIQKAQEKQKQLSAQEASKLETDEKQSLEIDALKENVKALQESNKREGTLFKLRVGLLITLFVMAVMWLLAIFSLVVASGISRQYITLPENVMLALIGSTTVNVLGLLGIGAKWLYPSKNSG